MVVKDVDTGVDRVYVIVGENFNDEVCVYEMYLSKKDMQDREVESTERWVKVQCMNI